MSNRSVEHATFRIERAYDAAPAVIFAAFYDKAARRRWFIEGEGWTIDDYSFDFRPGGREFSAFRFKGGSAMTNDTIFQDIVENRRIVMSYVMTIGGQRISASTAKIDILPDGRGTRLSYTEQGAYLDGTNTAAEREDGWNTLLDALGREIEERRAAA